MSAARARRRLMAHERYRRRCLELHATTALGPVSHAHARAYERAVTVGRWVPIGIRRDPWMVPEPRWRRWPP